MLKNFVRCAVSAALVCVAGLGAAQKPDFGPHVVVFDPADKSADMQATIDSAYKIEQYNEFGQQRYAFLFKPGQYHLDVPVGFYTQVAGLGASPDAVRISGNVHADASARNNNATTTFWRAAENFSVDPAGGTMQWAVSQAIPFRRMHVRGNLVLHQQRGWASGGWMSDSLIDGNVDSGTQQQWISRNSQWKSWTGSNWNMVFVGVDGVPAGEWPQPPYTKVPTVPVDREKPFLFIDAQGHYKVQVPALVHDTNGISWKSGQTAGRTLDLSDFYIAHPESDTAASINAALAHGKHLLLTPGIYKLAEPIRVEHADTVVYALGFATLEPVNGTAAMTVADVDGVTIAGILFDAGEKESPVLLEVGIAGQHRNHAANPTALFDNFFRVGGAALGRAKTNLLIHSDDVLVDHTWIWRADHGKGVGWDQNTSLNGLVVEGNRVTIYGLFVEHHQQYQVLWKGEQGRTFFYQSEIPYDPRQQAEYTSAPGVDGWASYKVADNVRQHEAWGLGIYSVFFKPNVQLTRAIEVPEAPGVRFHHMITVALLDKGGILNVINQTGGPAVTTPRSTPKVAEYPAQ